MKLSIVIVSYNTCELTVGSIKSVVKFAPKFSYEIIVVDNDSSDYTEVRVKALKIKNLVFIRNRSNVGFSKANNIGIKASKGEYLFLLNSDTKIINDVFTDLVEFAENNDDAGVVAPKLLNADESLQPSIFRFPTLVGAIKQYWLNLNNDLDKYGLTSHKPVVVDAVVGAAFLITPIALKKVGLLSEKYFMYFEDIDYCKKVHEAGLSVYYLPCSYIIHLHGSSAKGSTYTAAISSSKKYFGTVRYYIYTFVLWSGQKLKRFHS